MKKIAVVMLNWNRWFDTERAISSILRAPYEPLEIILVDNGSDDPAPRALLDAGRVRIVRLASNHGFARAVNIGSVEAIRGGADAIVLFNNDAIVPEGEPVFELLLERLQADADVGAVGPMIVNDDAERTVQSLGLRFSLALPVPRGVMRGKPTLGRQIAQRRIDYLMGSCLMIRASAFAEVNGMDPELFFLGDDVDFMLRLKARGYRETVEPRVSVIHHKSSTISEGSYRYAYSAVRSNLILIKKHARWYHVPSAMLTMLAISFALIFRSATSWKGAGLAPVAKAWRDFYLGRWGGFDGVWADGYVPIDFGAEWLRREARSALGSEQECRHVTFSSPIERYDARPPASR